MTSSINPARFQPDFALFMKEWGDMPLLLDCKPTEEEYLESVEIWTGMSEFRIYRGMKVDSDWTPDDPRGLGVCWSLDPSVAEEYTSYVGHAQTGDTGIVMEAVVTLDEIDVHETIFNSYTCDYQEIGIRPGAMIRLVAVTGIDLPPGMLDRDYPSTELAPAPAP